MCKNFSGNSIFFNSMFLHSMLWPINPYPCYVCDKKFDNSKAKDLVNRKLYIINLSYNEVSYIFLPFPDAMNEQI